jgi:C-terminal processing protease CtpA/Prc
MMTRKMSVTITILLSVLTIALCHISGKTSEVWAAEGQDRTESQAPRPYGNDANMPNGVIGLSLHVGAERIGDPASLYVAHVYPAGPAQQAGLQHGDEIVTVNGEAVTGKTYEQVIQMVRGEAGAAVKLGIKGEGGTRELSIIRIASETLYKDQKGKMAPHGSPAR